MSSGGPDDPENGDLPPVTKAYENLDFIHSHDGRPLRIMSEFFEPEARFAAHNIADTIVFFGSARALDRETATKRLSEAEKAGVDVHAAEQALRLSRYYEDARRLAYRLTEWSKTLEGVSRRFVVCTGGGPGIMEAANRGACEAGGLNVGLNISLPHEQHLNRYITPGLNFKFHYFFMRKFWFTYLAKAIIIFPGGFGTMDELFENLTLVQTRKLKKPIPIVLFGGAFWKEVVDLPALVDAGTIAPEDLSLFFEADSVDAAFDFVTSELTRHALGAPGGVL